MNKYLKIILGTFILTGSIALILPSMPLENWGTALLSLIKGGITLIVFLVSIVLIVLGITELRE